MNRRIYKRHYREAIRGPQVVRMSRLLRSCLGQPLIVIWGRPRANRSRVIKEYLATEREISIEWLPAYAPELNPEEYCHGVEEMQQQVDRGFNRLGKHPDLLLSFFHRAGLGVKRLT
jgi:DDE superfamily endonuclease